MPLTNDPTERDLLRAIVANPADDAPRLILADRYDELGENYRATFIRRQVANPELSQDGCMCDDSVGQFCPYTVTSDDGRTETTHYCPVCTDAIKNGFPSVFCGGADKYRYRRGFISEITCSYRDWEKCADVVLANYPIECVTLTTLDAIVRIENESPIEEEYCLNHDQLTTVYSYNYTELFDLYCEKWTASRPWLKFDHQCVLEAKKLTAQISIPNALLNMRTNTTMLYVNGLEIPVTNWDLSNPPSTPVATPAEQSRESVTERIRRKRFLPK